MVVQQSHSTSRPYYNISSYRLHLGFIAKRDPGVLLFSE